MSLQPDQTTEPRETIQSSRRLGRLRIADTVLRNSMTTGEAALLFAGSVPLDIQRNWMEQITEFLLWHPEFSPVHEAAVVPYYQAIFTRTESGQVSIRFQDAGFGARNDDGDIQLWQLQSLEGGAA